MSVTDVIGISAVFNKLVSVAVSHDCIPFETIDLLLQFAHDMAVVMDCVVLNAVVSYYGRQAQLNCNRLPPALSVLQLAMAYRMYPPVNINNAVETRNGIISVWSVCGHIAIWPHFAREQLYLICKLLLVQMISMLPLKPIVCQSRIILHFCTRPIYYITDRAYNENENNLTAAVFERLTDVIKLSCPGAKHISGNSGSASDVEYQWDDWTDILAHIKGAKFKEYYMKMQNKSTLFDFNHMCINAVNAGIINDQKNSGSLIGCTEPYNSESKSSPEYIPENSLLVSSQLLSAKEYKQLVDKSVVEATIAGSGNSIKLEYVRTQFIKKFSSKLTSRLTPAEMFLVSKKLTCESSDIAGIFGHVSQVILIYYIKMLYVNANTNCMLHLLVNECVLS